MSWRGCVVKTWSRTQSVIALSSAESEFYALIKASAETLGLMTMLKELGFPTEKGQMWGDASAALGIINRKGLGKIRHLEVSHLWIQGLAAERKLKYGKVAGSANPADMLTKSLEAIKRAEYLAQLNLHSTEGRASIAPMLHK